MPRLSRVSGQSSTTSTRNGRGRVRTLIGRDTAKRVFSTQDRSPRSEGRCVTWTRLSVVRREPCDRRKRTVMRWSDWSHLPQPSRRLYAARRRPASDSGAYFVNLWPGIPPPGTWQFPKTYGYLPANPSRTDGHHLSLMRSQGGLNDSDRTSV